MKKFKKVAIIGVGLLGGSIGMAIRQKKMAGKVTGFFRNKGKIKKALQLKIIDEGTDNFKTAVKNADFIILCTPISDIINKLKILKKMNMPNALITDVGSTKSDIVKFARGLNFVGSHPLAGSEQSGIEYARADLFKDSVSVLSVGAYEKKESLKQIRSFWEKLGSKTIILTPPSHDRLLAYSSHLPHAIACALMKTVPQNAFPYSAGGLKDTTRVALARTNMWADIFLSNQHNVLKALVSFEKTLKEFKEALKEKNRKKISNLLKKSRVKRTKLLLEKNNIKS